jgi:hypothetical protein
LREYVPFKKVNSSWKISIYWKRRRNLFVFKNYKFG